MTAQVRDSFFDGKEVGKGGKAMGTGRRWRWKHGIFPTVPTVRSFPRLLGPGEEYRHVCVCKFGAG